MPIEEAQSRLRSKIMNSFSELLSPWKFTIRVRRNSLHSSRTKKLSSLPCDPHQSRMNPNYISVSIYYGNRTQPSRVRVFIELALERLTDNPAFTFSHTDLAAAEAAGCKALRKRS